MSSSSAQGLGAWHARRPSATNRGASPGSTGRTNTCSNRGYIRSQRLPLRRPISPRRCAAFHDNARMRVLGGTVTAVDAAARLVIADGRAIPYDTLVLATGKLYAIQSTRTE